MDYLETSIPEEYVDVLMQEFAYDPIRLPPTEDPAQVLYNRRTLETIWEAKHEAVNPFTRQPFNINNVIPQAELRREMLRYIRSSSTLNLDVIPDYTKVLSEGEMISFLSALKSDYISVAKLKKKNVDSKYHLKQLRRKFNLLRLYCQYCPENRDRFRSIKGYVFLSLVPVDRFNFVFRQPTCDDAKEIVKEVGRIVDIIGLKESDLSPPVLHGIVNILCFLAIECYPLKIQGMILRIYRRMFYDFNIENHFIDWVEDFCAYAVRVTLYVFGNQNFSDLANEDLCEGMAILKAAWMKNQISCVNSEYDFVRVLFDFVILCISRFNDLHHAAAANEVEPRTMEKNDGEKEAAKNDDEAKKVHLISVALEGAFWLINSIVTATSENQFFSESKEKLHELDIVREIVGMVELVLAGFKGLGSSLLQFGINIVAVLHKEEGPEERNHVLRVFGDFLGSGIVDEYDSQVKLLVLDIMKNTYVVQLCSSNP